MLVATSTNHSEIIALYEASRECVWLRRMINHIEQSCGIGSIKTPTIIYEDNAACVTQMQTGYVNSNMKKTHCSQVILSTWPSAKWRDKCHANKILWQPRRSFHKISTNHLIWKMCSRDWYETASRVAGFRRGVSWELTLFTLRLTLFFYEFFLIRIFSYKIFNETMLTWAYVLSLVFPTGVFLEISKDIKYSLNSMSSW